MKDRDPIVRGIYWFFHVVLVWCAAWMVYIEATGGHVLVLAFWTLDAGFAGSRILKLRDTS